MSTLFLVSAHAVPEYLRSLVPAYPFLQFALVLVLCAAACGLILAGRLTILPGSGSEDWPAVDGVIIDTTIAADRDTGHQRFRPVVRYRYEVDGQRYEGSRIRWVVDGGFRKYTRARRLLDRYRTGAAIKVHYDPGCPSTAVLQTGVGDSTVLRPVYVVASTVAVSALFTIGIALAG
jgi:hypothetical protein